MEMKLPSNIQHTESGNFFLLAGPCVVESEGLVMEVAESIKSVSHGIK
jgi:2-dehydro-3-deoxyphosphooctonate aldolase (KDO 8-P synthase)